ncbi:hypothetical protein HYPSUDRAFT_201940 [Hypholoma sublateritium FD-334 SS-4]|uniref:Uncharacterized protein n=1 Tax=Hypholoma sublateritium (strain FD-334 SS-4) TaxID=945553 RepID=A0A0D2PS13_HYPSF|nr:hypothetical protein HYPSUDRAFT_201940 [Hypholoma sublateritium FD-334 SS-4]
MIIDEKSPIPGLPAELDADSVYPPPPEYTAQRQQPQPSPRESHFSTHGRASPTSSSRSSSTRAPAPTLSTLPTPLLLQIIQHTFPQSRPRPPAYTPASADTDYTYVAGFPSRDTADERLRRTLLWLAASLRLVSRALNAACMHVLRAAYLPAYRALVRPPYSSAAAGAGSGGGAQRENAVLDRFVLLRIRHDVLTDESSLHLDHEDAFRDLFDVAQPRARLEDLVRDIGVRHGVVVLPSATPPTPLALGRAAFGGSSASLQLLREVDAQLEARAAALELPLTLPTPPTAASPRKKTFFSFKKAPPSSPISPLMPVCAPSAPPLPTLQPLPFGALSVSFQPRRVGLVLSRTRTLAEVPRAPGRRETLEYLAGLLVGELEHLVCG